MQGTSPVVNAAATDPQDGAIGVEGKVPSNPPTQAATISSPRNGQSFNDLPITVSGLCPKGLLVKIFANNVFVGSAQCENGSYSIQVDLFSGRNDLVARVFDAFDQGGPDSNIVTVNFDDAQFNPTQSSLLSLTSNYAQRGANPGQKLSWPIILSGGTSPYAVSVDWGDGKSPDLISVQFTGTIDLSHTYDSAGIYKVIVKATDKNGLSAYLQLVAQANGAVTSSTTGTGDDDDKAIITRVLWAPAAICIPLIFLAFWLGRRYELATLRKHLEESSRED
ncbi:MAG TPA: PKD domain-containing protein [Candidatus Saccharimonadales bacterium]|nr:PKD domain-containing protein [Candidatus Saccharimonadales bacterium]